LPSSPRRTSPSFLFVCLVCILLVLFVFLTACGPAGAPREAESLRGGLYQLRDGVLVSLAGPGEILPVRRLPWTVQERVAAAAVIGERAYLGGNGRGVAELDLQGRGAPGVRYLYDSRLFAHRTLTTVVPAEAELLVHLYFNAALNVVTAEELALRGLSLLRLDPPSGEYRPVTPPFQAVRPEWEAVGFVAQSPRRLHFEWKWSGPEESRFLYTVLSLEAGARLQENRSDALAYRNSYGFRDVEREGPAPLKALFREARRRLDNREASTAYHIELRREGSPLPERFEYHPPGFARAADIRLHTLAAVERGGRYALLLPDGLLLRAREPDAPVGAARSDSLPELSLPPLPTGHHYGALLVCEATVLAAWEQPLFTEVGSAGIFLRKVPDFP